MKNVVKLKEKSKEEKEKIKFADMVGTAEKTKEVKDLRPSKQMKKVDDFNVASLLTQNTRPKRNAVDMEKWRKMIADAV